MDGGTKVPLKLGKVEIKSVWTKRRKDYTKINTNYPGVGTMWRKKPKPCIKSLDILSTPGCLHFGFFLGSIQVVSCLVLPVQHLHFVKTRQC